MPNREKVIEILEKAKTIIEGWVPMFEQYNTPAGIDYAIALLKEQEAPTTFHVIDRKTGKEADTYRIALKEKWATGLVYCDMEGFAIGEDGSLMLLDECGNFVYCDRERFEVVWDD